MCSRFVLVYVSLRKHAVSWINVYKLMVKCKNHKKNKCICTINLGILDVSPYEASHPHEAYRDSDNMHHAVAHTKHQATQRQRYGDGHATEQLKAIKIKLKFN